MQPDLPITLADGELPPLEPDSMRLVAASNGWFWERNNSMFQSSIRAEPEKLGIVSHHQYCCLRCGRLPRVMHRTMLSFFLDAHHLHGGEAALVLMYHPETKRFRWHCPVQKIQQHWVQDRWVPSDIIRFSNPTVLPEGYLQFGDSHLHVGASSTPSQIDVHDDQDGLHIIVANIHAEPSYHIDFVVDGKRFGVAPSLIFEDPDCRPDTCTPTTWLGQLRVERTMPPPPKTSSTGHSAHSRTQPRWRDSDPRDPENGDSLA